MRNLYDFQLQFFGCAVCRLSNAFFPLVLQFLLLQETNLNAQQMANEQVHCQGELLNCCGALEAGKVGGKWVERRGGEIEQVPLNGLAMSFNFLLFFSPALWSHSAALCAKYFDVFLLCALILCIKFAYFFFCLPVSPASIRAICIYICALLAADCI